MSIPLANIPARLLSRAAAWTLAVTLAACGGRPDHRSQPHSSPPVTTYDVFSLSLPGGGGTGVVRHNGITADGKVAGAIDMLAGGSHAFFYDGDRTIDLGTMGGQKSEATGVNQRGQVVGMVQFANYARAFLYDGTMHDLGTLGGADSSAFGINERGQVTGYATNEAGVRRVFLYSDGKMNPVKGDGNTSAGWAINAGGEIAGDASFDASGALHVFLSGACGCARDLGTLGGAQALAYAINDAGELVGVSDTAAGQRHAFLYRAGIMKDLGTFGGAGSFAAAINLVGHVAGRAETGDGASHAFLYDGGGLRDLGTLGGNQSGAVALNGLGQVVGFSTTRSGGAHAFVWGAAEGMVDLNARIPRAPWDLVLSGAAAIADNGSIVAYSNYGLVMLKVHRGAH